MACMQKSLYRKERAKKKEMDKLAQDMIQCKADGYGCHYGAWKAMQDKPVAIEKKEGLPEDWRTCLRCGKPFKPNKYGKRQMYCEYECQKAAQRERDREKMRKYHREDMAKRREAERAAKEAEAQKPVGDIVKEWEENRKKVANENRT